MPTADGVSGSPFILIFLCSTFFLPYPFILNFHPPSPSIRFSRPPALTNHKQETQSQRTSWHSPSLPNFKVRASDLSLSSQLGATQASRWSPAGIELARRRPYTRRSPCVPQAGPEGRSHFVCYVLSLIPLISFVSFSPKESPGYVLPKTDRLPLLHPIERRASPNLSLELPSNNPFRNRAVSPSSASPAIPSPQSVQSAPGNRPVSRNPFLAAFEEDKSPPEDSGAKTSALDDMSAGQKQSPQKTSFGASTQELFVRLLSLHRSLPHPISHEHR